MGSRKATTTYVNTGGVRARDLGIRVGILPTGGLNAITDVAGVRVGHTTLFEGTDIRTGVTAILPHAGNLHAERVPAGIAVGNGFGKLAGSTQIEELGELESPILLTNTLSVGAAIEGAVRWTLAQPGNEAVRSVNAVVGETNDGFLNNIRALTVRPDHAIEAIDRAADGPVVEGGVGAGTGTQAFGWKGGIGTSSRTVQTSAGPARVGVLVQTNFGGVLSMAGAPLWREFGQEKIAEELSASKADGSVIFVVATDAPVSDRNLTRMAKRSFLGLARTGSPMTNGSGDYAIAFSTSAQVRRQRASTGPEQATYLPNDAMSLLFLGVVEAAEEAVYNSMLMATTVEGHRGCYEAIAHEVVKKVLKKHRLMGE